MNKKLRCYLGGGWFSANQDEVLTSLEELLSNNDSVEPYFPRVHGVKLEPEEFHDPKLRERIFQENVKHILESDLVVAACDGRDGFYDTGTQWEVGYAMANNIPVVAYDTTNKIYERMRSITNGFLSIFHDLGTLDNFLTLYAKNYRQEDVYNKFPVKILFIGPDTEEKHREVNSDLVSSVILECHGSNFRWVDNLSMESLYESIDNVFEGIDYMISVIDDRHPIVSWIMGQAYSRNIPVITYTNFDYGVNIMLLHSLMYHCKGKEELKSIMQKMKRDGIYSLPKFDDSSTKAM